MHSRRFVAVAGALLLVTGAPASSQSRVGANPPAARVLELERAWDIDISPDGAALPAGSGTAVEGRAVFARACSGCHLVDGSRDGRNLVGGIGTLSSAEPHRTVASFWPYATTLYSYIARAMPADAPGTLTPDEVYAVSALLLGQDGIVAADARLDRRTLPLVQMPNRGGFRMTCACPQPRCRRCCAQPPAQLEHGVR